MKKPNNEDIINKWSSILGPMGMTGSQLDNISQLVENQSNHILGDNTTNDFPSLLPLAMKVAAKTIATDLIFASQEEIDGVKKKVQSENRDGKIQAVIEGGEYVEKKSEDIDKIEQFSKFS